MRKLGLLTAAAAIAAVMGFGGTAKAAIEFTFDGDLVAYWPFDTPADATPDDEAPSDAVDDDGTFNGGAGYEGGTDLPPVPANVDSLEVDGTGDFMSASDSADLDITGPITLSAWINPSSLGAFQEFISKGDFGDTGDAFRLTYFILLLDTDVVRFGINIGGAGDFVDSAATVSSGVWTHVAATFDPGTDDVKIYLNGALSSSGTITATPPSRPGDPLYIGGLVDGVGVLNEFDGLIDEVRIYDVVLDAGDIQTLASAFPGTVEKELVSGPNDDVGVPIVVDVDPFDAGGVQVSRASAQHFQFKITIRNDGEGGAIDGLKIFDVVGAEFDPDPDAEDGTIDEFITNPCPDGVDCDGIDDTAGTGVCTASINEHDSDRKLDPHFIRIVLNDLEAGETCIVTVWVVTSQNPASAKGNKDPQWEPTSCDLVMAPDLFNTFTLNEGVKVFDPDSEMRLLGPVGSLQLTCNFPE